MRILCMAFAALFILNSCQNDKKSSLPFYGERSIVKNADGSIDSLPPKIRDFSFINQNGDTITNKMTDGKVYISDFFFTSCPTICPKVKKEMLRVYEAYKDNPNFVILSHSIDTKHDTVARLAWYAGKLGIPVENTSWHLLTGDKDGIYAIAYDYLLSALEDDEAEGGYDHSGAMTLVDKNRHIRGIYDGLEPAKVDQLIKDIAILLAE